MHQLMLDTANLAEIKADIKTLPISGVTTNPTILRREGDIDVYSHLSAIKEMCGTARSLHVQVVSTDTEGIIKEARFIRERTYDYYLRKTFGGKCAKIPLDGGFTCPNIDGKCGYGGCIYCSDRGSGDFAESAALPIGEQFRLTREKLGSKWSTERCIPYFQAFTNFIPFRTIVEYIQRYNNGFQNLSVTNLLGNFVLSSGYFDAYYNKAKRVQELIKSEFSEAFGDAYKCGINHY